MPLQDELTRNLFSMTTQALYTTMTTAHSAIFWVTSRAPVVFESVSKASSGLLPFWFGLHENATPSEAGSAREMGAVFYYYNAIDTIILLLTIWIYFKTLSLVWRSVSVVWETTVGICNILGFFASKLRGFLDFWGLYCLDHNVPPRSNEETIETTDDASPLASNLSMLSTAGTHDSTNTPHHGHSRNPTGNVLLPLQQQPEMEFPPHPPLDRVLWYYFDPITQKVVPWIPPPATISPFASRAPLIGRPPMKESVFVPIPETPIEDKIGQMSNNSNTANSINSRMENVRNQNSSLFRCPSDNICEPRMEKAIESAADLLPNDAAIVSETNIAKDENRSHSKKRKYTPETLFSPTDNDTKGASVEGNPSDDDDYRLGKKQRL